MYTIYALIDPRDEHVRYVGITEDVYARFLQHLRCTDNNIDKNLWMQELKSANVMLIMRTVELAETFEDAREREDYWIHYHLSQGERLLNVQIARSFTFEDFTAKINAIVDKPDPVPVDIKTAMEDDKPRGTVSIEEASNILGLTARQVRNLLTKGNLLTSPRSKERILLRSVMAFKNRRKRSA